MSLELMNHVENALDGLFDLGFGRRRPETEAERTADDFLRQTHCTQGWRELR